MRPTAGPKVNRSLVNRAQQKKSCGNAGAVENVENHNQVSHVSHRPLEISPTPRDFHIPTAQAGRAWKSGKPKSGFPLSHTRPATMTTIHLGKSKSKSKSKSNPKPISPLPAARKPATSPATPAWLSASVAPHVPIAVRIACCCQHRRSDARLPVRRSPIIKNQKHHEGKTKTPEALDCLPLFRPRNSNSNQKGDLSRRGRFALASRLILQ